MTRRRIGVVVVFLALATGWALAAQAPEEGSQAGAAFAELKSVAPAILSRSQWHAKPPLPGMKPQAPRGIILHHTAVAQNPHHPLDGKLRNLQSFSQKPGRVGGLAKPAWPDVPYHYYIDAAGGIAEGRDVGFAGDTNTNYDPSGYIQVVAEGNFEKEQPTAAQLRALADLLVWLTLAWNVPVDRVSTHDSHAATSCPGRNFKAALGALLGQVVSRRQASIAELCARQPVGVLARRFCKTP
jgi:hypothetical protein